MLSYAQMAKMSSERQTITTIRSQIELAQAHTSTNQPLPTDGSNTQSSHVTPGSWDSYHDVQGYEEEVMEGFGFVDFAEKLACLLQRFKFDVHGEDFDPDAGHRIHIKRMRVC